jgi:hypothetical protein
MRVTDAQGLVNQWIDNLNSTGRRPRINCINPSSLKSNGVNAFIVVRSRMSEKAI